MHIGQILRHAVSRSATAHSITPTPSVARIPSDAATVTLSKEARAAGETANETAEGKNARELRELLSKFDFHSIAPRDMARLATELVKRGEVASEDVSSFLTTDIDLMERAAPDAQMNMVEHFDRMLRAAESATVSEPVGFEYAVKYREQASELLSNVMSFAASDRLHIRG